jgi:predicted metal-dependent TIM-barrel fold hydrolase
VNNKDLGHTYLQFLLNSFSSKRKEDNLSLKIEDIKMLLNEIRNQTLESSCDKNALVIFCSFI